MSFIPLSETTYKLQSVSAYMDHEKTNCFMNIKFVGQWELRENPCGHRTSL